jgi:type IV pilus assembly protein PilO
MRNKMNNIRSYKILQWLLPVFFLFLTRGILQSQWEEFQNSQRAVTAQQKKMEQTGLHIRKLPDLKKDFENLALKKVETSASLFDLNHQANIYEVLLVKAGENGVTLTNVSAGAAKKSDGYYELPVKIQVSGGFHVLGKYINIIENLSRLLRVQEILLSRDNDGNLSATLEVIAYLYDENKKEELAVKQDLSGNTKPDYVENLQQALSAKISPSSYRYIASGEDLFGNVRSDKRRMATVQPDGKTENALRMRLKGILWKNPPLAILEMLDGKTWIVKTGDTIDNVKIISITPSDVTISSKTGSLVLQQYEKQP